MQSRDEVASAVAERLWELLCACDNQEQITPFGGLLKRRMAEAREAFRQYAVNSRTDEINDKNGWVYDPGKALENLRRAEAAELRIQELMAALALAKRYVAICDEVRGDESEGAVSMRRNAFREMAEALLSEEKTV